MDSQPSSNTTGQAQQQDVKLVGAKRQVAALKGFYIHLFIFTVVILGLTLINIFSGRPWWIVWVLAGWGIGVVAHAIAVFGHTSKRISDWEERKIREFMDRQ